MSLALVGGAAYATHVLNSAPPHLTESCHGITVSIASPAQQLSSPQQFVASGGTLIPRGLKQAARLPHPQYWVLPKGAVPVYTCTEMTGSDIEIGTNVSLNTELHAISVVPFGYSTRPWLVPFLRIPHRGSCAPRPATFPIYSPDGRTFAQLAHLPKGFSRSVSVVWPPCDMDKGTARSTPAPLPPLDSDHVEFQVMSEITYKGKEGAVRVVTGRASAMAMSIGLDLGNPLGKRHDGITLFQMMNSVRWLEDRLIVSVSGNLPLGRLKGLAADVVLRTR